MARNIVNQQEITDFIDHIITNHSNGEGKVEKWMKSVCRNYLLNDYSYVETYKVTFRSPQWAKDAYKRGDQLLNVLLTKNFKSEVTLIGKWLKQCDVKDITRVSYADALAHAKQLKKQQDEEEIRKKASKGVELLCNFSDGVKAVVVKDSAAIRFEGQRQKNCLADYIYNVKRGDYKVVSIRDQNDKPIVSIGYNVCDNNLVFQQARQKCNDDVAKNNRPYVQLVNQKLKARCSDKRFWSKKTNTTKVGKHVVLTGQPITNLNIAEVFGNLNISKTKIAELPKGLKVHGGLYASDTAITAIPAGEYHGHVDISRTKVTALPENSVFHGNVYCNGLNQLHIPKTTTIKGKVYR